MWAAPKSAVGSDPFLNDSLKPQWITLISVALAHGALLDSKVLSLTCWTMANGLVTRSPSGRESRPLLMDLIGPACIVIDKSELHERRMYQIGIHNCSSTISMQIVMPY
jgi:hypothetical protein